jgi:simple sugar transport system permease protein
MSSHQPPSRTDPDDQPGAIAAPGEGPGEAVSERLSAGSVLPSLVSSLGAVAVALVLGAVVILISGDDPVTAYKALFSGSLGDLRGISETLVAATPLILAGLGFMVAFRAGLFNIGLEGQLVLGGLVAGLIATYNLGPWPTALPISLAAAAVAGGVWAALAGALKARTGASEVITTIMLNYLAFRIATWAVGSEDLLPVNPGLQATEKARMAARLTTLPRFVKWLDSWLPLPHGISSIAAKNYRVHAGIVLALLAALVLWYVIFKTTFGYKVRTVGLSRGAAAYAGFSYGWTITSAMFISGLLAGLAGAGETLGLYQGQFYSASAGLGFTAIAVGLVGRNHPAGVILAGLLFGILKSGATEMQNSAGTSKELVQILQALVILAIAAFAASGKVRLGSLFRSRSRPSRPAGGTATTAAGSPAGR